MDFFKRNIDIILILLIGFLLRFTISFTHSYSNDELSAVNRLRYTNFSDLIEFGVQKDDMHPAGVEVFMKTWSLVFGKSEIAMRLPFVLFGTAAILVLFLIGKKWFNRKVGLLAAGLLAVLYFPIMNSEFARPYSPGLFLSLLVGWYFYKVLFEKDNQLKNAIVLGVLFAAGMYTHYFAFLFVGFIGVTGLLFLTKDNWKYFFLSGALGILLFLPHISITAYHLNQGGLQWLPAPSSSWLAEFLFHAFNTSWIIIGTLVSVILVSFIFKTEKKYFSKRNIVLPILWFFGIYVLGHFLSLISTPILKFPVMLFAFPYFLLLVGLIVSEIRFFKVVLILIMGISLVSTILEKDLYGHKHFALFKEVGIKITDWRKEYGKDNIYTIYNINNSDYMNFYADEWGGENIHFDWEQIEFDSDKDIYKNLIGNKAEYCIIGYSSRLTLVQIFETVREFYPIVVDYEQYNNGAVFLMKKGKTRLPIGKAENIARFNTFNSIGEWDFNPERAINHDKLNTSYTLDSAFLYGPTFHFQSKDLPQWENAYLKVEIEADIDPSSSLVVTFTADRNKEPVLTGNSETMWIGHSLENMLLSSVEKRGFFAFKIPTYILPTDELKISLWNNGAKTVKINSFKITYLENMWN